MYIPKPVDFLLTKVLKAVPTNSKYLFRCVICVNKNNKMLNIRKVLLIRHKTDQPK